MKKKRTKATHNVYKQYRQALGMPNLTVKQVDEIRRHLILLAQTICEHVWGRGFH